MQDAPFSYDPAKRPPSQVVSIEKTFVPSEWEQAIRGSYELHRALRADFLAQLDRDFLYGHGTVGSGEIPLAPLRVRLRWRWRVLQAEAGSRYRSLRWRYRDAPRERLARRVAPWLMDEAEAQDRYGDW